MSATTFRRRPIFSSDVRSLGGTVCIVPCRSHVDPSEQSFRIEFASRGRDLTWSSPPFANEDQASAAARAIASFTGGVIVA
jgi:hypothetical protein